MGGALTLYVITRALQEELYVYYRAVWLQQLLPLTLFPSINYFLHLRPVQFVHVALLEYPSGTAILPYSN